MKKVKHQLNLLPWGLHGRQLIGHYKQSLKSSDLWYAKQKISRGVHKDSANDLDIATHESL